MTSLLVKSLLLAIVVASCQCRTYLHSRSTKSVYHEIILETDGDIVIDNDDSLEDLLETIPTAGCKSYRPQDKERDNIVNLHNKLRQRVAKGQELRGDPGPQPPARNMRDMHYDRRLEEIALSRAAMCSVKLPLDRTVQGYPSIHRSLLFQHDRTEPFNITDTVLQRYDRVDLMAGNDVSNFNGINTSTGKDVRSYAIIVNAKTYGIGCAHSYLVNRRTRITDTYLICYYGSGLGKNEPLYLIGEPCEGLREDCCDGALVRGYCWQ